MYSYCTFYILTFIFNFYGGNASLLVFLGNSYTTSLNVVMLVAPVDHCLKPPWPRRAGRGWGTMVTSEQRIHWHVVPRLDHVLPPVKAALFKSKMFAMHFKCKNGELLCKKKTDMSSENTHSNMWLLCSICSLYVLKIGEGPLHWKTSASTLLDFRSADARATGFTSAWRPNQSPASNLGYKF